MSTSIKGLLQQLGIHSSQADVYLACLRLGEASTQDIAHEAQLQRTTVASILERLQKEGFISMRLRNGKRRYWIEDPHILVEREKARLSVFEELQGRLHTEYHKADHKPDVEQYDSKEAIMNLMCKVIDESSKGEEFLTWECPAARHYQAIMPDELYHALSKRKTSKGIRTRALIPSGHQQYIRKNALAHAVNVRVLPLGLNIEISLWIIGDSVILFSGTHAFALRVHHKHTAESLKNLFEFLWNTAISLD